MGNRFPFLIGTVRTQTDWEAMAKKVIMFPFLIGTVRTETCCVSLLLQFLVSIPHRYGKNEKLVIEHFMEVTGFPFLIGTVRTLEKLGEIEPEGEFPFLIGTVRTNKLPYGRLEGTLVSIPHRYGKNPPPHM